MNSKLQPALLGGLAIGVASAVPLVNCANCLCCAWAIAGGFLAAYLYFKDVPGSPEPPYGDGAILGAMAGAIGAVVTLIISIPIQLVANSIGFQNDPEQMREMFEQIEGLPPEAQDMMIQVFGGSGMAALLFGFLFNIVLFTIFAAVGGLIGVAVFQKKTPPTAPAPPVTTPPPPGPAI